MKQVISQTILAGILVLFASASARATEFWVDGLDGNDANNGLTVATAKQTIQAAVVLATTAGDIVNILPGEYLEGFILGTTQSGITVRGVGEVVIVDGPSSSVTVNAVSGNPTRIETITFRLSVNHLNIFSSSSVIVERCRFVEPAAGAISANNINNVTIRECLFVGPSATSNTSPALLAQNGTSLLIEDSTFARNNIATRILSTINEETLFRNCAFFENTTNVGFHTGQLVESYS